MNNVAHDRARGGRILVVCTGNICRSPYVERVLARRLRRTAIEVASAGTRAMTGWLMDRETKRLLIDAGGSAAGFASRQLTAEMAHAADLVIVMEGVHRQFVVDLEPTALRKTFVLKDLSAMMARYLSAGHVLTSPEAVGASWVATVLAAAQSFRERGHHSPPPADVDLADPYGKNQKAFERMTSEVDALLRPIVQALNPAPATPSLPLPVVRASLNQLLVGGDGARNVS